MPTTNSGTSDVLSEDWPKVFREAVEATAVDQAKRRFQPQPFLAKVDDFKPGSFRLAGGQATAVLDRHTAKVEPQNRKTLISQPPADLTATTAQVDDALTFRKPARVDRFNQLLLRLLGFPEGGIFRVGPLALPSAAMSLARPIGKALFNSLLYPMYDLQYFHKDCFFLPPWFEGPNVAQADVTKWLLKDPDGSKGERSRQNPLATCGSGAPTFVVVGEPPYSVVETIRSLA